MYDYARDGLKKRGLWTRVASFAAQITAAKCVSQAQTSETAVTLRGPLY